MNITKKNKPVFTLNLTEMELALILHAIGRVSTEQLKDFCSLYGGIEKDVKIFDSKLFDMYTDIKSSLEDYPCEVAENIYSRCIKNYKEV